MGENKRDIEELIDRVERLDKAFVGTEDRAVTVGLTKCVDLSDYPNLS